MSATIIDVTVRRIVLSCDTCGMEFAVPQAWEQRRRQDHAWWYCPNGHQWQYTGKSDAEQLREAAQQRDMARLERDRLRADLAATEGKLTAERRKMKRLKNRVAHGVCPCCSRSFTNLQRHMVSKHPNYVEQSETPKHERHI